MTVISNCFFNFINFCAMVSFFLTKLLTLGIFSLTALNAEVLAKPLILGILFSILLILELKSVYLTISLVSGVFFFSSPDLS